MNIMDNKNSYHTDMPAHEYHAADAVSNGELLMMETRPSDVKLVKQAPRDPSKTGAADYGTALHTALLEPEKFDEQVLIGPTKSRDTKAFMEFEREHGSPDKVIVLESEYDRIRMTMDTVKADPTMDKYLRQMKYNSEASVFVYDEEHDLMRKIRIDVDYVPHGHLVIADAKSTASLDDWRSDLEWKNPLWTMNYGHTAAYYLDTASMYYGQQIDSYIFHVLSKSAKFGVYFVDVIEITREELENYGFFDRMRNNLAEYAARKRDNDWVQVSRFPIFRTRDELADAEISYEGDNDE